MKSFLTLMVGLAMVSSVYALDVEKGKAYRIVSSYFPDATICVGSQHAAQPYIFSNKAYSGTCKDAFWYFVEQSNGAYAICNANTKEYITYTTERINGTCKGLKLTGKDEGAASHWFFREVGDGSFYVYTEAEEAKAKGDNYWNQRTNASDNYLVGTYRYEGGVNSTFLIVDGGTVGPDPGPGPDIPDPTPTPDDDYYTIVDGGEGFIAVGQTGNRLTIIPSGYVESYEIDDNTVTFTLLPEAYTRQEDSHIVFTQVEFLDEDALPADLELPSFTSYKFNNKFNYQVPVDAVADNPSLDAFTLAVGGIGKWLTPSYQMSHEGAVAYVGEELQASKVTRMRFDHPVAYTVGYKTWRQLEVRDYSSNATGAASLRHAYVPFGRRQTVTVDWLCDKPTTQYGVPRIDILMTDHPDAEWGSSNDNGWGGGWDPVEYFWLGQNGKKTYENAQITIDGGGVFPDMEPTPIQIKGRGNSSWKSSSSSKNPYHFKFESGQKPLGLTKGKHWILLSNKQTGSMTTNAIGHRVADMMGGAAPCHIIPVELYINDSYRGSYNLCERIGLAANSVDLDDETYAGMVELDTYTDETIYKDSYYYIATKMKSPDFDDEYEGPLSPSDIMADWETLMATAYYNDDVEAYVDVDRLAAYLAANEMICNCELKHAKSCFAYSADVTDGFSIEAGADITPWVFGPLWDCDWAFGYEQKFSYFQVSQTGDYFGRLIDNGESNGRARRFWNALLENPSVNRAYFYKWYNFATCRLPELLDFCDDYYAYAKRSFDHNRDSATSNYDKEDYQRLTDYAKQWLQQRTDYVMASIKRYEIPVDPVDPEPVYDDPTGPIRDSHGVPVGIELVATPNHNTATAVYDLQGRRAAALGHSVVVVSGRKAVTK